MQWVLFSVLSIASLLLFRRPLLDWLKSRETPRPEVDSLVGEAAVVLESIPAKGVGKAELRGSSWSARGAEDAAIPVGSRCRVQRVDGLTLWIKAD